MFVDSKFGPTAKRIVENIIGGLRGFSGIANNAVVRFGLPEFALTLMFALQLIGSEGTPSSHNFI